MPRRPPLHAAQRAAAAALTVAKSTLMPLPCWLMSAPPPLSSSLPTTLNPGAAARGFRAGVVGRGGEGSLLCRPVQGSTRRPQPRPSSRHASLRARARTRVRFLGSHKDLHGGLVV